MNDVNNPSLNGMNNLPSGAKAIAVGLSPFAMSCSEKPSGRSAAFIITLKERNKNNRMLGFLITILD